MTGLFLKGKRIYDHSQTHKPSIPRFLKYLYWNPQIIGDKLTQTQIGAWVEASQVPRQYRDSKFYLCTQLFAIIK